MQPALYPVPVEERSDPHPAMAGKFLPESWEAIYLLLKLWFS